MLTDPSPPPAATEPAPSEPATSPPDAPPVRLVDSERTYWVYLLCSAAVLVAAGLLVVVDDERVGLGGTTFVLPGTCVSRYCFHIPCPGCGLTRCFVSMAHGDPLRAFAFNPAGVLLFLLLAAQIPYHGTQIWRLRNGLAPWDGSWMGYATCLVAFLLIAQWLVRLLLPAWFIS